MIMKKMKLNTIIVFILFFVIAGCDTWEDNLNIDPNNPTTGGQSTATYDYEPSEFMLDMLYNVIHGWDYIYWNVGSAACVYHGKTISLSQGNRHQAWHAFDDSNDGGPWVLGYKAVRYIRSMRNAAIANDDKAYQAVATIWECYDFFGMTLLFGDIPYSQSIIDNAPLAPVYDKQEDIYFTLMSKLREASLSIDPSTQIDATTDLIFSGDMNKWKKFANTLLIRYAMYMSDAAPDSAKATINTIISQPQTYPIMESNEDNAKFHYDGVQFKSKCYTLSASKMDEAPFSNVFIERLISLKDPRLPIYARPALLAHSDSTKNVVPSNTGIEKYAGHIYGITTDNAYASAWNNGANYASKFGEYFRKEDDKGTATIESATYPLDIATYAEMSFFLAEAKEKGWLTTGLSAEGYYKQGIEAAFKQYNASFDNVKYENAYSDEGYESFDAYYAQQQVLYRGGRDKLTMIAEQKWIASFLLMFEPYFDHRRTMLPAWRASSGADAYVSTGSATKFPSRASYPNSESSTNKTNVDIANATAFDIPVVDQGTRSTALMWLLQPKGQNWLQMPVFQEPNYKAEYPVKDTDSEFGTEFYSWYSTNWNTMFWWKNNDN
jgi:hypothetical protein